MDPGTLERLYVQIATSLVPIIELLLMIAAVVLTFASRLAVSSRKSPAFVRIERCLGRLARRQKLAVLLVGISVIAIRVTLIPVLGVPKPMWHDEYSFLLAADTFAHGRLTNSSHPMWKHFESFHIIEQPTYMSMYPPAQGLVLAAGQLLVHPWVAQLLTTALMCSVICWMLQGWLPPTWALFGAFLVVLRIAILSYWMNSYFAGSLIALAGALVLGALPRIQRYGRLRDSILMGIGLAVLANTRPYEGLVFSLPIAGAMLLWIVSPKRISTAVVFRRVILPLVLILLVAGAGMGYYFWRVTGSPFVMPYQVNRQSYAPAPYFIWQSPRSEPIYHHAVMRDFYIGWELHDFESGHSLLGFFQRILFKIRVLWMFYAGTVFALPFVAFPYVFRDHKMKFPLLVAAVVSGGTVLEVWTGAHYIAAATGLFFLLLVQCMRHLRLWRWSGKPVGVDLIRAIPLICLAMIVLRVSAAAVGAKIEPPWPRGNLKRAAISQELAKIPGQHLVIVRYGPNHPSHVEWVYNRADINSAKIVWARDMGNQDNQELLDYFKDRHAWIVYGDDVSPRLQPY